MSEIRYDPIHDEYALIAPERLHRPDCYHPSKPPEGLPVERRCPFCEGHESMTPPEIYAIRDNEPNGPGWRTRVVPNLYKAVQIEAPWQSREEGVYSVWEGLGAHEVIVDTPRHLERMDAWRQQEYIDWLTTLRARVADLRNDIRLVHFSLFKNHGPYAAATQTHPHTQLIALPVVPRRELDRLRRAHRFYRQHRHNLFVSVLRQEKDTGERIVTESERFVAFCPYASAFAFELMVLAKVKAASIVDLDPSMIEELSTLLRRSIAALYRELGDFDFNILFDTPPMQKNFDTEDFFDDLPELWRFSVRIVPRLFRMGGFELGSGMMINPVVPEEAASLLRLAMKEGE